MKRIRYLEAERVAKTPPPSPPRLDQKRISTVEDLIAELQTKLSRFEQEFHLSVNEKVEFENVEVNSLKKKLRDLGQTTTQMCMSLRDGLSDVQATTLALYDWGDQVHFAIGKISEKVGMMNPCPRIPSSLR